MSTAEHAAWESYPALGLKCELARLTLVRSGELYLGEDMSLHSAEELLLRGTRL